MFSFLPPGEISGRSCFSIFFFYLHVGKGIDCRPEVVPLSIPPRPDPAQDSDTLAALLRQIPHIPQVLKGEIELMRKWNS